jgi:transcription antitermination factor NusB
MRKRTMSRELALQVMYQLDLRGQEILDEVDDLMKEVTTDPEVTGFAKELVFGTWERRAEIDSRIEEVAVNWEIKRMAAIDRNILRLATFEILFRDDIPPLVSINEAIEIAKKFSTKNSGPFVNGILDNIRLKCAPAAKKQTSKGAPPAPNNP